MSDYTPTIEQARREYVKGRRQGYGDGWAGPDEDESGPEFDRWLAAHDAEVRADEREKAKRRVVLASMQGGVHAVGCGWPLVSDCFCHVSILAAAAARGEGI